MGEAGSQRSTVAAAAAERLVDGLAELGDVASRGMFGGYGIFADRVMFALVDSSGRAFFRVVDGTRSRYEVAGSEPHGRMPYMAVPADVLATETELVAWGAEALAAAREARR